MTRPVYHPKTQTGFHPVAKIDKLIPAVTSRRLPLRSASFSSRSNEPALAAEFRSLGESAALHAGRGRSGLRPLLFPGGAACAGVARGGLRVRGGGGRRPRRLPHARHRWSPARWPTAWSSAGSASPGSWWPRYSSTTFRWSPASSRSSNSRSARSPSDRRLQVLLIAFAFGALLEGAGGGGAPVAVTGAMMIGLGFPPFQTALLCLIANSAPVAYGGMGNPVRTLVAVTGLPEADFSAMLGRILPLTTLILPSGWSACLCNTPRYAGGLAGAAGVRAHLRQHPVLLVEFHGRRAGGYPRRHRHAAGAGLLLPQSLEPAEKSGAMPARRRLHKRTSPSRSPSGRILLAWSPFLLLAGFVVLWGLPPVTKVLDTVSWKAARPRPASAGDPHAAGGGSRRMPSPPCSTSPGSPRRAPGTFLAGPDRRSARRPLVQAHARVFFQSLWRSLRAQPGGDHGDAGRGLHHALLRHGRHHGNGHGAHRRRCSRFSEP